MAAYCTLMSLRDFLFVKRISLRSLKQGKIPPKMAKQLVGMDDQNTAIIGLSNNT